MTDTNQNENEKVARAYFQCYNTGDVDEQTTYFAEDGSFTDPVIRLLNPSASSITVSGKQALQQFLAGFLTLKEKAPDVEYLITSLIIQGDKAAIEWKVKCTLPTGKIGEVTGVEILSFKNGKIQHARSYADTAELSALLNQLR
ncbi:MAG: nuclear transport factor 2 family protein [Candidatus Bathyarchaeia archaeon]